MNHEPCPPDPESGSEHGRLACDITAGIETSVGFSVGTKNVRSHDWPSSETVGQQEKPPAQIVALEQERQGVLGSYAADRSSYTRFSLWNLKTESGQPGKMLASHQLGSYRAFRSPWLVSILEAMQPKSLVGSETSSAQISRARTNTQITDAGVDVTLIHWMLSMNPSERLEVLQAAVNSLSRLSRGRFRT